jgi:hypothetical protein
MEDAAPCPSGGPHLQSRSSVCDHVRGTVLIPPRGSAHGVVLLSPEAETNAVSAFPQPMDKKQRSGWSVPELSGWTTARGVHSGTGRGSAFRALSAGLGSSGEGCRNRSFSGVQSVKTEPTASRSEPLSFSFGPPYPLGRDLKLSQALRPFELVDSGRAPRGPSVITVALLVHHDHIKSNRLPGR